MKTCFKCKRRLSLKSFYKHPMMSDGHLGKCRECAKKDVHDRYVELSRSDAFKQVKQERTRQWRKRNPEKNKAHGIVSRAVATGLLIRSSECEQCGCTENIHAHHDDYSKPLEVWWLCVSCHLHLHELERIV